MMIGGADPASFLFLNREGRWADFVLDGLQLGPDGSIALWSRPVVTDALPEELRGMPAPDGPAGVAVGADGAVFASDPRGNRLLRLDPCTRTQDVIPCLGGDGGGTSGLRQPRGLLVHPTRPALVIADSGNHRLVLVDPETFVVLDIWGQPAGAEPAPGALPGELDTPVALAADPDGSVFVVERGNRRVQRLDRWGNADPSFWATAVQSPDAPGDPLDITVGQLDGVVRVIVLDGAGALVVLATDGTVVARFPLPGDGRWLGLGFHGGSVLIGNNARRTLQVFRLDPRERQVLSLGTALGYAGPVAALAFGPDDRLHLHPGEPASVVALAATGGVTRYGRLVGGPFPNPSAVWDQWHRLRAKLTVPPEGAHLRIAVFSSPNGTPPAPLPRADYQRDRFADPADGAGWTVFPVDAPEGLVRGGPLDQVWVVVELVSEGLVSPRLAQVRLDFDYRTALEHLPAIYREDAPTRELMVRFLGLFESVYADLEEEIDRLPTLLDPAATPAAWLPWLAEVVDLAPDPRRDEATTRRAIADALPGHARRGTLDGLRRALRAAGVEARIEEPIAHAAWWVLPADDTESHNSRLGHSTMLGPAEPGGAVVGTTATLDASHLLPADEWGAPLFEDIAHQFAVQVYRGRSFDGETLDRAREVLDGERPAHTAYHVCVVEPAFRVGFQATLGVDAIVAGPPPPAAVGQDDTPGQVVLGGPPPSRIGAESRVGRSTRLGRGAFRG